MHVVIDSECDAIPEQAKSLNSEGRVLLNLLQSLGYAPDNPPFADLLRQYHNLEGEWIVLTPVHWEATHNDAMIVALGKDLQLTENDSKLWFDLFSEYLAEEGAVLHYHDAENWLIHTNQPYPLNAKPPQRLLHRSLMPELAQLDNSMHWQKFITESQMLFASKPNQSFINGLWVWGNSKLKEKQPLHICVDAHFFPFAELLSTQVTLYTPEITLKEQQIILLSELSTLSKPHQEELKKMSAQWYWNNTAYSVGSENWFVRLWRKIIHAN